MSARAETVSSKWFSNQLPALVIGGLREVKNLLHRGEERLDLRLGVVVVRRHTDRRADSIRERSSRHRATIDWLLGALLRLRDRREDDLERSSHSRLARHGDGTSVDR